MPGPEFERDKAMFELNVAQNALRLTVEAKAEQQSQYELLLRAAEEEKKTLKHAKARRITEERRLETLLNDRKTVMRDIEKSEQERDRVLQEVEDIKDIKDVPKLVKEVVRLKVSISRLSLSRDAILRELKHLGSEVSESCCQVCKRPAWPLTARLICGDCIAEGLIDLHRQAVPWVLEILPEEPKPPTKPQEE